MQATPTEHLGKLLHTFQHDKALFVGLIITGWLGLAFVAGLAVLSILAILGLLNIPIAPDRQWGLGIILILIAIIPACGVCACFSITSTRERMQIRYYEGGMRIQDGKIDAIVKWAQIKLVLRITVTRDEVSDPWVSLASSMAYPYKVTHLIFGNDCTVICTPVKLKKYSQFSKLLKTKSAMENIPRETLTMCESEYGKFKENFKI